MQEFVKYIQSIVLFLIGVFVSPVLKVRTVFKGVVTLMITIFGTMSFLYAGSGLNSFNGLSLWIKGDGVTNVDENNIVLGMREFSDNDYQIHVHEDDADGNITYKVRTCLRKN